MFFKKFQQEIASLANTSNQVREFQRKLYLRSKQAPEKAFYSLYDKICRFDILWDAYYLCRANRGAAGVDGVSFEDLKSIEASGQLIKTLRAELVEKTYQPLPVKRVQIPKDNGKTRNLGIPSIRDRIVQMACTLVLSPVFEPHFHGHSYGYRPKRSAQDAVKCIHGYLKQGYSQVYDADLSKFFDTIPHSRLLDKVRTRVTDRAVLRLIKQFLKAPISEQTAKGKTRIVGNPIGTPQGGVISPLLANIYLNDFCLKIASKTPCKIISYADDFVVLSRTAFNSAQMDWIKHELGKEGLALNESKTHTVDMTRVGNEFDFLGFTFKYVVGFIRYTNYIKLYPSKKSQKKYKDKLRHIVKHRTSLTLDELVQRVNRVVRGWKNYFGKVGYPRQVFFKMDWFLVARFYRWSRSRSQRRSLYLAQDAWAKLRKAGLVFLQPTKMKPVKVSRRTLM